ncbi:hypothetical protein DRO69_01420 [Candidatus Bathyarchaeota archaeon]|nr:MAG: hypothetical protein DRO69_01420 [Candidatus Bathyarchaeota archaeon]
MYLSRGFMLCLIFSFILLVGILYVSANQAYVYGSVEEANQTRELIETERQEVSAQSIFLNNLLISLPMIVPAVGLAPFLIAWHNTGWIIGLLSLAYGVPPSTYISNLIVLAFPELLSYAVLCAENIYVTVLALFKAGAKQRITQHSWKSFIFYILLLFIGAVSEANMIASVR